jgi:hypothetical protein
MSYLVEVAPGLTAIEAVSLLQDAFIQVTTEVMDPTNKSFEDTLPHQHLQFDRLRTLLNRRDTDISDWLDPTAKIKVNGGQWDCGEVETNLRQIEVIILALRTPQLRQSTNLRVNPTQQSGFDVEGTQEGTRWALEAYGGVNVTNNGKLAEDAETLSAAKDFKVLLFACRPSAWRSQKTVRSVPAGMFKLFNDPTKDGVCLFEFIRSDKDKSH